MPRTAKDDGLVHWLGCVAAGLVDCGEEAMRERAKAHVPERFEEKKTE